MRSGASPARARQQARGGLFLSRMRKRLRAEKQERTLFLEVIDGDYKIMADKIRAKTNPDMLFLSYDGTRAAVVDFFVVLRHFFTIPVIERRTALSEGARRAGWVGCSILLSRIPEEGRVHMVRDGRILDKRAVLRKFQRTAFLDGQTLSARGWMLDVWPAPIGFRSSFRFRRFMLSRKFCRARIPGTGM